MNETNLRACLLIYDIPERSGVRNPWRRLRSVAVRVNLSCRVIREGDVPYALLAEMAAGGATWHVVRFDAGEGVKLVGRAGEALKRDVRDAMRRANRSARGAGRRLDDSTDDPIEVKRWYAERTRPIIRRLTLMPEVGRNQLIVLPHGWVICGFVAEQTGPYSFRITDAHVICRTNGVPWDELADGGRRDVATYRRWGTVTIGPQFVLSRDWVGEFPR